MSGYNTLQKKAAPWYKRLDGDFYYEKFTTVEVLIIFIFEIRSCKKCKF